MRCRKRRIGTIAHRAIEQLSAHWNLHAHGANHSELQEIADAALRYYSSRANIRIFWGARLLRALVFVNTQETIRRAQLKEVRSEIVVDQKLPDLPLTLHGRIDRLEQNHAGEFTLSDYKTGKPPTENDVSKGKAVQLLAYAMLLEASGQKVDHIDYWGLPSGKRAGKIQAIALFESDAAQWHTALYQVLATFMQPQTPLLARPVTNSQASRFENPYDGISRYDEWAE